jgi:glucokinase
MYLVFDIGGTNLRAGLYDPGEGRLVRTLRSSTPSHWSTPAATATELRGQLFRQMAEMADGLLHGQSAALVCVAFPGPVDGSGRVLVTPTVWGGGKSEPFMAAREFERVWPSATIYVINDVTAAGYRYLARGVDNFCILTVSSGIGHKVFVEGREIVGCGGRGGEIGHWVIDTSPDAPLCDCGGRGHLGALASGRGALSIARRRALETPRLFVQSSLWRRVEGEPAALETEHLVAAFLDRDLWTVQLIADVTQPLGRALGAIHLTIGVERFVIIGGFALALGDEYRRLLAASARDSCIDLGQDWDHMIELGCPDDDSGLVGAGLYIAKALDAAPSWLRHAAAQVDA